MESDNCWRVLLNEYQGKFSRLILSNYHFRCRIDVTIQSQNVDRVVHKVLSNNWNGEQLQRFLRTETDSLYREAL